MWLPVVPHWCLNERHYGALQGVSKVSAAQQYGEGVVQRWRRGFKERPPDLPVAQQATLRAEARYAAVSSLPASESLEDVLARVLCFWRSHLLPALREGKRVLVVGHSNSLRALVMFLDGLSEEGVEGLNIPTCVPIVYKLDISGVPDPDTTPVGVPCVATGFTRPPVVLAKRLLGDEVAIKARALAMSNAAKL